MSDLPKTCPKCGHPPRPTMLPADPDALPAVLTAQQAQSRAEWMQQVSRPDHKPGASCAHCCHPFDVTGCVTEETGR